MMISTLRRNRLATRLAVPIDNFELLGDWSKNRSFKEHDRKLLQNPKAVKRIIDYFAGTSHRFDFYFLNNYEAGKYVEYGPMSPEDIQAKMGITIQPNPEAITVLFTNNKGTNSKPMTAWIIAHRLGHTLRKGGGYGRDTPMGMAQSILINHGLTMLMYLYRVNPQYYSNFYGGRDYNSGQISTRDYFNIKPSTEKALKFLWYAIGTMKSAQNKNLNNPFELVYELLAQYLLTGSIKFNPPPQLLQIAGGDKRPTHRTYQPSGEQFVNELDTLARDLEHTFESALGAAYGKIYVM